MNHKSRDGNAFWHASRPCPAIQGGAWLREGKRFRAIPIVTRETKKGPACCGPCFQIPTHVLCDTLPIPHPAFLPPPTPLPVLLRNPTLASISAPFWVTLVIILITWIIMAKYRTQDCACTRVLPHEWFKSVHIGFYAFTFHFCLGNPQQVAIRNITLGSDLVWCDDLRAGLVKSLPIISDNGEVTAALLAIMYRPAQTGKGNLNPLSPAPPFWCLPREQARTKRLP